MLPHIETIMPWYAATLLAILSILSSPELNALDAGETLVHPEAPSIIERDWRREGSRERNYWSKWSGEFKAWRLRHYQAETEQAVAGALARSASRDPLPAPPRRDDGTPDRPVEPLRFTTEDTASKLPPLISVPAKKVSDTARSTAKALDQAVDRIDREVFGNTSPSPTRPGLFVLLLIAMFLIPSTGLFAILTGIVHLRAHSFRSGGVFLLLGGVILWAVVSSALAFRSGVSGF